MTKGKIIYKGNFGTFFFNCIGLILLCMITFGLATPYFLYWIMKYFVDNLEIEINN